MQEHMTPSNLVHVIKPAIELPRSVQNESPELVILGVHGGAGESTLAALVEGWVAGHHAWWVGPVPQRTLLCARTHAAGLDALSQALQAWASGAIVVDVVGIALIPDAPGRLPKQLRDRSKIVSGAAPRAWWLDYVDEWRLGQMNTPLPRAYRRLINALS